MGFLGDLGLQTANSLVNSVGSMLGTNYAVKKQKELMDYQWNNYQSPSAQVRNMAAAGINPAVALGNQAPVISSSPSVPAVEAPQFGIGTSSLTELSNYIKSLADAKKSGADTKLAEKEAEVKKIESERQEFELNLRKLFGPKQEFINLSTAAANLRLATLSGDNAQIQKEMGEYTKAKEAALAKASEHQRDMLEKELNNMDIKLKLQNDILSETAKTEKSKQSANYASVEASKAAADVSRENRRLQAALADIEEAGKTEKINSLISEYKTKGLLSDADAKDAQLRLDRLSSVEDKRTSTFFREVDNYLEWLKNKVSIFKSK